MNVSKVSKKLIGTITAIVLLVGAVAFTTTDALAQFIDYSRSLKVDGVIDVVSEDEIVILTSGSEPITVLVDNKTRFKPKGLTPDDLMEGDQVEVRAKVKSNGDVLGLRIEVEDEGPGYGTAGDKVKVLKGEVIDKGSDTITVETKGTTTTFKIMTSTKFVRTNFFALDEGDDVMVKGEDTGTEFVAKKVIRR